MFMLDCTLWGKPLCKRSRCSSTGGVFYCYPSMFQHGRDFLFLSQIKQICACFSKLRLLAVCHVRQIRFKCLMIFFGPVLFCFCCFQALDFCLILFFCTVNDFLYSIIPEAKTAILFQISCSAYRCTVLFALFKFYQASNAKIISCKKGSRFRGRLKDFGAFLSLLQKLWSQDPGICTGIHKASLPHPFGIGIIDRLE